MYKREEEIFAYLLMAKGITHYEIAEYVPEGHELPGCVDTNEIDSCSGLIVTLEHSYRFWLEWEGHKEGHYTLGDERDFWYMTSFDILDDLDKSLVLKARQQLSTRTPGPVLPTSRQPGELTPREAYILRILLHQRGIEHYTTIAAEEGDRDLIGSLYPGEVRNSHGILATAHGGYRFGLDYQWGSSYFFSTWEPVTEQECSPQQWQEIEQARQHFSTIVEQELVPILDEELDNATQEQPEQWKEAGEEVPVHSQTRETNDLLQDEIKKGERVRQFRDFRRQRRERKR
jgi:hypothetical protein